MTYTLAPGPSPGPSTARQVRFACQGRLATVLPMSAITALVRGGFRLAVTAMLTLAVLLAGSGLHPASHCSDHAGGAGHAGIAVADLSDDEDEGLCLSCDCSCQSFHLGDVVAIDMSAADVASRVQVEAPAAPDEIFLEVEPPPVRSS